MITAVKNWFKSKILKIALTNDEYLVIEGLRLGAYKNKSLLQILEEEEKSF